MQRLTRPPLSIKSVARKNKNQSSSLAHSCGLPASMLKSSPCWLASLAALPFARVYPNVSFPQAKLPLVTWIISSRKKIRIWRYSPWNKNLFPICGEYCFWRCENALQYWTYATKVSALIALIKIWYVSLCLTTGLTLQAALFYTNVGYAKASTKPLLYTTMARR